MTRPVLSLAPLLALLACSGGEGTAPAGAPTDAGATRRDTLVVAWTSDVGHLNPVVTDSANDAALFDGNLSLEPARTAFDCSLKKSPGLAKEWAWSDDGKTLSVTLRDDIQWADGKPVTAEDIAFTFGLISDPKVASPRVAYIQRMTENGRPEVLDSTHIAFHFTEAYDRDTQFAHALGLAPVPKHLLENADREHLRGDAYDREPVSNGPWRIASYKPGDALVFEPNDKFTGPAELQAHLNRVIFRVMPEYNTRLLELERGTVDMMEGITIADADRLVREHPEIKLHRRGWRFMDYVGWNLNNPKFQDPKVRKALAMAVNVDAIIDRLLTSKATGESYGRRAVGSITPELCGVHNDSIQPIPFDAAAARALFAEAGWTDTDGDGILDKDGQPFSFRLVTNNGNQRRADAAVIIQAMLKEVGVDVQLEQQDTNLFFENLRKKQFDAALAGWSASLFVDPTTIWHSDTAERKYEFNFVSYSNPAADALMDKGLAMPDPREAAPVWRELQQVIYEDQPYLFLYWRDDVVGLHERFGNAKVDILSPLHELSTWEVPADKVKYPR